MDNKVESVSTGFELKTFRDGAAKDFKVFSVTGFLAFLPPHDTKM